MLTKLSEYAIIKLNKKAIKNNIEILVLGGDIIFKSCFFNCLIMQIN